MIDLIVKTAFHSYPIFIAGGMINNFDIMRPYIGKKVAVVTNDVVAKLYLLQLRNLLKRNGIDVFDIVLPDGEQYKNHDSLSLVIWLDLLRRLISAEFLLCRCRLPF